MQYYDAPDPKRLRRLGLWGFFGLLAMLITILALTASNQQVPTPPAPSPLTTGTDPTDLGMAEHRVSLTDGRTVLCLTFTGGVSCDWSRAGASVAP